MKLSFNRSIIIVSTLIAAFVLTAGVASAKEGRHGKGRGHDIFEQMDVNKDGKISKAESAQVATERFKKMDANSDGVLTKAELTAAHEARHAEHPDKRAKNDKDRPSREGKSREGKSRDGKARPGHRGHGPGDFFAKVDTNNDGKITQAEAQKAEAVRFAQVDTNKDGVLTPAELKAAHEAHRKGGDHNGKQACGNGRDKGSKDDSPRRGKPA